MRIGEHAGRWLIGLFVAAWIVDVVRVGLPVMDLPMTASTLPLAAGVLVALRRPVLGLAGGLAGWAALSLVFILTDQRPETWGGVPFLLTSEEFGVAAMIGVVIYTRTRAAIPGAVLTVLLAAGLVIARAMSGWGFPTMMFYEGAFTSVVVVGAGVLGGVLARRGGLGHWPVGLVLAVLLTLDAARLANSSAWGARGSTVVAAIVGVALVVTSGLALGGSRWGYQAAGVAAATGVLVAVFGTAPERVTPLSVVVAHLVIVVAVCRDKDLRTAAKVVGALGLADLFTLLVLRDGVSSRSTLEHLFIAGGLAVVAIGGALYLRTRDTERSQEVRAAVFDERMALARELHDVVAHHVTGIVVQAQAAQLKPSAAMGSLGGIEKAGVEALTAMRRLVSTMRAPDHMPESATGDLESDLLALANGFTAAPVRVAVDLPPALPQEIGRSVLRVVQESLTNVARHARAVTEVAVRIGHSGDELRVEVADDGEARQAARGTGYGLVGMRERVTLLGGGLTAGPAEGGGWVVDVRLPLGGTP
ncbi:sensor histidine kinase [Actinokineospora pegani]|uniref:sensor histidine kinase n=1 Tax=Actinokineospora pegani TaxID=2654637 RepID=UPI0012EAB61C|nr:histidine kinase [Actinokineospora pegani]